MMYQYKVTVQYKDIYKEFEIPEDSERVRLGTTRGCEFRLDPDGFFGEIEILLERREEQWTARCPDNLYINRGDIRKLYFVELAHGDRFFVCYADSGETAFSMRFRIDFEAEIPTYDWKISLAGIHKLNISDRAGSELELQSAFGQNTLVQIQRARDDSDRVALVEYAAPYGSYVNGRRITGSAILHDGDFLSVADFSAFYRRGELWFSRNQVRVNRLTAVPDRLSVYSTYPRFVRSTRVRSRCDETPLSVLDPPNIPTKPDQNIATSLLPAIAMFALVVVLRGFLNSTGSTFVLFSICSMGLGVVTSIISLVSSRKKYRENCENRRSSYEAYIERKRGEIEQARDAELACLREQYYSTQQDLEHIDGFASCLFDRVPEDDDFLDVYLGVGVTPARRTLTYKNQEKLEAGDDLCGIPEELARQYRCIGGAPVILSLRGANAVGVVGTRRQRDDLMKIILLDIVSRQYFGDVRLYMLLEEGGEKYGWIRMLPHLQGVSQRNIVCDTESRNAVFENLYKELTARSEEPLPGFNIVFVLDEHGIKSHPISKFIQNASEINTVFLFFEGERELLPLYCTQIIEADKSARTTTGTLYGAKSGEEAQTFAYTPVSDAQMARAVRTLAPVFCEEISLESSLRKSLSLFELLQIYGVGDLDLEKRWAQSKIYESMAVPLGVNAKNETVYLDIHEKFHGPHGLVAGTTGSGKSETLQTFILGAATLFSPNEIGFVIIDFKGGGMVNQFKNLPHLMGAITNIDGKAVERSLKSIKAELLKRQELFAKIDVNHIDKYIKAYKEGRAKTALPHLVIIVDEFAELKAEQPEFMKELISTARIGRSLGVHLILATQKPAGQVNEQIWSNSRFKICLKVQTQEDSKEVLKSPLAAEIREPGRAYLQVGNDEIFELFQSGFSGAMEKSDGAGQKSFAVSTVNFKGNRDVVYRKKAAKGAGARTQLEAVVDYVNDYCEKHHIARLPEICLPQLEETIVYDPGRYAGSKGTEMNSVIGIYDDPDHQFQGAAVVPVASAHTMIIGSSQYGKTNLLEVLIRSLAETYSPEEVNIYIIDFASMVLKNFEKLAHVGGVVCPSDDEKLKNLFKYLGDQVNLRREKLLSKGVSSFTAYREAGYSDLPQIVLVIDNMTALKELYLQDNDMLLAVVREGLSVGISVIVANAQTSGLGYKYMANFATRIALFCNDSGEYVTLYGSGRTYPDEIPGRCLMEMEKTLYECQTFLAFEGEKEIERVQRMQAFVERTNAACGGKRAVPIPEIPDLLGEQYIFEHFGDTAQTKQILGLGYDSVAPLATDVSKGNMLTISGAEDTGRSNFIRYFLHSVERKWKNTTVYIFDDYRKKLASLAADGADGGKEQAARIRYQVGTEGIRELLIRLEADLQEKYQQLVSGGELPEEWNVLVINNEDAYNEISGDKAALAAFKNLVGKYRMLRVYVICAAVPNTQIVFGSPEVYKLAKETKNILFFDEIENCKLADLPLAAVRNNRKKRSAGDAFYLAGNECMRIKTPLAM